jgi:hypothetical protein
MRTIEPRQTIKRKAGFGRLLQSLLVGQYRRKIIFKVGKNYSIKQLEYRKKLFLIG